MTQASTAVEKVKRAREAIEEAKRAIADLPPFDVNSLSESELEELEQYILKLACAYQVRRLIDDQLEAPLTSIRAVLDQIGRQMRIIRDEVGEDALGTGIPKRRDQSDLAWRGAFSEILQQG